mmetsp:Transcript_15930/g.18606  ORF Transcript_15930/g.18606 Transcript_15930/m.18606 type:complete len:1766 (-) Transcript_15930:467-5764(-)
MAQTFAAGTYVWLRDDEDMYVPAKVAGTFKQGEKGTVTNMMTKSTYTVTAKESSDMLPMDEQSLEPTDDMVGLKQLDEPALLHNLRLRYEKDEIYTNIGSILVSVNPFKKLNIYSPDVVDSFMKNGSLNNPPHIYGVADRAYKNLIENNQNQSCIVSGESGAGKTEATKLFLQYIAEKSSAGDSKVKLESGAVHEQILEANPLMEAFGNAKTVRNDNSSRFGKLIQVDFEKGSGKVVGGNITQYLLEKSRIVKQAPGERNYHIFYYLCANCETDSKQQKELQLQGADQNYYTSQYDNNDAIFVEGINDQAEYGKTLKAMDTMGISSAEQADVMRTVAAVLHIGNIEMTGTDEKSEVKNKAAVNKAAEMLGVSAKALEEGMVKRKMRDTFKLHSQGEAEVARDAFAKALYGQLFNWLIGKINQSLNVTVKSATSISVLDIFGFESFEVNSFEQLCINYCNEKLQGHFNEHIFSLEQELYKKEGIDLAQITFADNAIVLSTLEDKKGVFAVLNEENKLPKGSDTGFLSKVLKNENNALKAPTAKELRDPKNQLVFIVTHYAGPVRYTVTDFLDKNKDRLFDDLAAVGASSKSKFVSSLFKAESKDKKKTLSTQFKEQLDVLMTTLRATEPHYVRTIKPNAEKIGDLFTAEMVLDQMRYSGLMEVCRIRKLGYPVRKTFKEFVFRYRPLAKGVIKDHGSLAADLEGQKLLKSGEYQIGKSLVFMRNDQANILESKREDSLARVALTMQKAARGFIARRRFKKYTMVLKELEAATKAKDEGKLEKALQNVGILPYLGNHIPVVQKAKETLAHVIEAKKVMKMVDDAIAQRDLAAIERALSAAKEMKLSGGSIKQAEALKATIEKERSTKELLEKAIATNTVDALKKALAEAKKMKMTDHPKAKDAESALQHLEKEEATLKALEAAIKKGDNTAIVTNLTIMAELGNTEHPLVKQGQEKAKQIAKASKAAEKKMKEVERQLKNAVANKDLGALKELNPKVIQYGLKGAVVTEANSLMKQLQAKEDKFGELSALKHAVEVKASSYDGVTAADVKAITALLAEAKKMGFSDDDDEIKGIKDFEIRMKSQVEAQSQIEKALKSGDETQLKKAMDVIQELGLETGLAQQVREAAGLMQMQQAEKDLEKQAALTEKIKKSLVEGNEDDRSDEKLALMEKRTKEHEKLIAKASDSKYDFTKYYKIREDSDYLEFVPTDAKASFGARKLKSQTKLIPKSLLQLPQSMSKSAVQVFKAVLQYCGDLANPYPNTLARFMIVTALEQPALVDEIYCQLMKHVVDNNGPVSEDRGWGLLCMSTASFPPSAEFAPYLVNFFLNHRSRGGLIGNYAKLCIVQLDGRIRLGATKLLPDLKVIDTYSQRPPILAIIHRAGDLDPFEIPVTPDEDLDRVLCDSVYPQAKIPEKDQFLYGIFVIDGKPKVDMDLRKRLTLFYKKYNPAKLVHVDYFVSSWQGNEEALFHTLIKKYGPEPTAAEYEALERGAKPKEKKGILTMAISAGKQAGKRLGIVSDEVVPPAPETQWPMPWWVFLGDVFLRMVKQGVEPVFTFKRKLYVKGEKVTQELIDQARLEFRNDDLAVNDEKQMLELVALELSLRNGGKAAKDSSALLDLGLKEICPVSWLAKMTPSEIADGAEAFLSKIPANKKGMEERFFELCKQQASFGMSLFYLYDQSSVETLVAGVDTAGIHILDHARSKELQLINYRTIKEFGATSNYFWMKVVGGAGSLGKGEEVVYLNTIQAWDIYGLVYDYTHNAGELNL